MSSPELTTAQREFLLAAIDARIARLETEIGAALNQPGRPDVISLPNHFEDTDDAAVAAAETATEVAAVERDDNELRSLQRARVRLDTNQAGRCEDCSESIPWARLSAVLTATRCVSCQTHYESRTGRSPVSSL